MSFYEEPRKKTNYVAKKPDENGYVHYSDEENAIWAELYQRQIKIIENRACDEYLLGIEQLKIPVDRIPQLNDISTILTAATGWSVAAVPALIGFKTFFTLLANRKFPAATFIRTREEIDYLSEPDIFHEIFGHCPLLTNNVYADFMQAYGELGLKSSEEDRVLLARLYWFTVEFGLIQTKKGLRCYGGGILSSMSETVYALESPIPQRKALTPLDVLRTPYRIDILQTIYFVINDLKELYDLLQLDLIGIINQARALGEFPPSYEPKREDHD